MTANPDNSNFASSSLPAEGPVMGHPATGTNNVSRNRILSWSDLDSTPSESITQVSNTGITNHLGLQNSEKSFLRATSRIMTILFYKVFNLLYEVAKLCAKALSALREKLRN